MRAGFFVFVSLISIVSFSFFAVSSCMGEDIPQGIPGGYIHIEPAACYGSSIYDSDNLMEHYTVPEDVQEYDSDYLLMYHPLTTDLVVTWDFTNPIGNEVFGMSKLPTSDDNNTITELDVVMIFPGGRNTEAGHFAISWDYPSSILDYSNPMSLGTWYESETIPAHTWTNTVTYEDFGDNLSRTGNVYSWEIWSIQNGTGIGEHEPLVSELLSEYSLRVIWFYESNPSLYDYSMTDYVGIEYTYYTGTLIPTSTPNYDVPALSFSTVMYGMIWMLVIFLPALLLGVFAPQVGFIGGLAFMLIVFSVVELSFIPTMIIGMIGIAIVFYKGG